MPIQKFNNFTIDYLDQGSGPPVILLPSSGSGKQQWHKLISANLNRFRMVSIDLFGYGNTSKWTYERQQTLDDCADLVMSIAASLGEHISLVGHSFGGSVAMQVALRLGQRVKKIVLIEPNPFYLLNIHGCEKAFNEISLLGDHVKKYGNKGKWKKVASYFLDYWNGDGTWDSLTKERQSRLIEMIKPNLHEWDAVLHCIDKITNWQNFSERMFLIKGGETKDSINQIANLMKNHLPNLRIHEVPGCGHMLPISHPHIVNPMIVDFLHFK